MKHAWIYICIPPILGVLVLFAVKSALSVDVPTKEQIDAAPSRNAANSGRQLTSKRLAEALRHAGIGSENPTDLPETPDPSPATSETNGPDQEDLKKRYNEGKDKNDRALITAGLAGLAVMILGYLAVGLVLRAQFKKRTTWQQALETARNAQTTQTGQTQQQGGQPCA